MSSLDFARKLRERFGDLVSEPMEFRGEVTVQVSDASRIREVSEAGRELGFDFLLDISSVDNFGDDPRFTLVYEWYSLANRTHLRIKTNVGEEKGEVPTVSDIWKTANWHEREIYDMMGIRFSGHPDLRRILMWEGYPHFPLRKDFPLCGKSTDVPEIAFTNPAPLEGGPFVTTAGGRDALAREPRVRIPETDSLETNSRLERRADVREAHVDHKSVTPNNPESTQK